MQEKLGPNWFDIGNGRWQHEETGRIVEGDGPFVSVAMDWREACEVEHEARVEAETEVRRLRDLLDELLVNDGEVAQTIDSPDVEDWGCYFCHTAPVYHDGGQTEYPHTAECVVTRAKEQP